MLTPAQHHRRSESRALLPKHCQPKATKSHQLTTSIYHYEVLNKFTGDEADKQDLWDWVQIALVYSEMTRRLIVDGVKVTDEAVEAMDKQLLQVVQMIERFKQTGRISMLNGELENSRSALHVMDQLIAADKYAIAWHSHEWAKTEIAKMKAVMK
jgi:hypothetical protein